MVVEDEDDITTVFKLGLEKADFVVDANTYRVLALSEYKLDMYDCFQKKPILLPDLLKSVKTRLGL